MRMNDTGAREGAVGVKVYRGFGRFISYMVTMNTRDMLCLFLLFFLFFLPAFTKAEELTVVGAIYEPFIFVDRDGNLKGFDVDLINLLCTSSGYSCRIELTTFKDALDRLKNGTADVAIGAIYITEERKRDFLFTEPYLKTGLVAVTRTEKPIDVSNLSDSTIGVKLGATGERIAEQLALKNKGLKIRRFLTTEESFEALAKGEVDIVLNDYLNSLYLIMQKYTGRLTVVKGFWGPVFFQKTQLAYPVRKDRPDLHKRFNQVLREVKRSGLMERFKENWFGIVPSWKYLKILQTTVIIFSVTVVLIILVFFIYRNRELKRHSRNLQGLLKELPGAVFVIQNGKIVYSNPTAREMFNSPTLDLPVEAVLTLTPEQQKIVNNTTHLKAGSFEIKHKDRVYTCYYNPIEFNKKPSLQLLLLDITVERTAQESIRKLYRFQEAYNNILKICTESDYIDTLLTDVLDELLNIDFLATEGRGMVFRYDEDDKALELISNRNVPERIVEKCRKIHEGDCLCGLAIKERRIMFIPEGAYPEHITDDDSPHSHYLIPVYDNDGVYALFNLYMRKEHIEPQEEGFAIAVSNAVRNGLKRIILKNNLKLSLETFHLSVDNFPLPVVIYTEESRIVHINQGFIEKFGGDFKNIEAIIKTILTEEEAGRVLQIIYPDQWKRVEGIEISDRNKHKRQANLYFGPVGRIEGRGHYMFVLEDTTEEEILKRQLIQSQKMEAVARLSGGVAHDFNNILGAVMGHAELAMSRIERDHPVYAHLEAILNATQRASLLTGQLLAFSKRQMTKPRPLDVNKIISSLLRFIERILGEDIQVSFHGEEPLPPVMADPVQIEQILLNLLVNARDAMPEGGSVEIRTYTQEGHVVISLSDTGPGIPEEIQDRIFEPFFTTKPEGKGTGLGLSTVKSITEELKGRIEFSSKPLKGTTFRVFIPVCEDRGHMEGPVETQKAVPSERISLTGNVVVVEDDTDVRDVLKEYLEFIGIKARIVSEPERALEYIDEDTKILITDLVMPGVSGLSIAEEAKKKWPSLKVLFITGFVSDNELLNELERRKLHVLTKPFTLKQLTEAIKTLLI